MQVGSLIIRLVVGGLFVGHGLQKLRGSFGGPGLDGTEEMMEDLEMRPARANALAAAVTETAGGAAIALGAATPAAAAGLIGTMVVAVRKVHGGNGVWNTAGGWEYNGVLVAALAAVVADGPGTLSIDALIGKRTWGAGWALAAVAAGAAGSAVLMELGKRTDRDDSVPTLADAARETPAPDSPSSAADGSA